MDENYGIRFYINGKLAAKNTPGDYFTGWTSSARIPAPSQLERHQ
jgi:hypothetical protein